MISRREFLASAGAAALAGCAPSGTPPLPPGELLGMNFQLGHRLRDGGFPAPSEVINTRVAIVGGGVSGLAAGWKLAKAGFQDFLLFELENEAGGNSRAGQSNGLAYPWGAHYLPLPPPEATAVRELLAEIGVLQGDPTALRPVYDERYLCATPQERVFRNGWWEEGLMPHLGIAVGEREQQQRFQQRMESLKHAMGRDGRRVFALPMELSSRDPAWLALDRIDFRQWLLQEGFDAPSLHWLANYACRDDFGTRHHQTSAWAGLHYFACRSGEGEGVHGDTVLTAPEGNAWLVKALAARCGPRIRPGAAVWQVRESRRGVEADVWLAGEQRSITVRAETLIWAAPAFVLPRVWPGMPTALAGAARAGDYAPWLVANLHLSDLPEERHGTPPAWDNVLYEGHGLGYVVASHQLIRRHLRSTVFTYYRDLSELEPAAGRKRLLETPREVWAEQILGELSLPHPDIRKLTTRLDLFRFGHAMRCPVPGSLWGGAREALVGHRSRVLLAHADLSGFSIFEEAQYRGVRAAERVLRQAAHPFVSSLV